MPRGDRTGPGGMGPMTGRGAGYCGGFGMGFGRGGRFGGGAFGGAGRGWRHWFYATGLPSWMRFGGYTAPYLKPDPDMEKQALREQAESLQSELDFIKKRLSEIETGTPAE
jgi:hypothetical protein